MKFDFQGIDWNFSDVQPVTMISGRYLNEGDILGRKKNVVIEEERGGYTIVRGGKAVNTLKLRIAGLFTDDQSADMIEQLRGMADCAHRMGVPENIDVFQNLSFLSLPVIPELRITDIGLFDVAENQFIKL